MDDDELIAAVAAGDDVALRELFTRHAPWLAARLRSGLPPADVEDVLQETFLAVWRGAKAYQPSGAAGGWLWTIARRQAALWLRSRKTLLHNGRLELDQADPHDLATGTADRLDLAEAIAALTPADERAWQLLHVEDRPVAEVAKLMGIPEGTVKSRAHRARRMLRAALRAGGQREPEGMA
jgi:RNA polymerase sigma-70 factor (ECF subfamily)